MQQHDCCVMLVGGHTFLAFYETDFTDCQLLNEYSTSCAFWFLRPSVAWHQSTCRSCVGRPLMTLLAPGFVPQRTATSKFHAVPLTLVIVRLLSLVQRHGTIYAPPVLLQDSFKKLISLQPAEVYCRGWLPDAN